MSDPLLIYGATGYTGRLIVEGALRCGVRPLLCGRSAARVGALAERLGLAHRVAQLGDTAGLDAALSGVQVVLHAAGPFAHTAGPMVDACLRAGVHYLDITGEVAVIEALAQRHTEARARGVMIMPGVGFDVVPSDCLAAHVATRLPGAERLALAVSGLVFATRGSMKTIAEQTGTGVAVRRDGALTAVAPASLARAFDFGAGPRPSLAVSWGDVASAYYTTGIPNIEVYFEATPALQAMLTAARSVGWLLRREPWQAWLRAWADALPEGPSESERHARETVIVAEAVDARGRRATARLRAPEAYTFTGMVAPAIAQHVLRADLEAGFQTPARVYGADFALGFPDVGREDLD